MELRLTLVDPRHVGARTDVAISAPVGTPLSAVAEQLARALGAPDPPSPITRQPTTASGEPPPMPASATAARFRFRCGATLLDESAALGLPPLMEGAVILLDEAALSRPDDQTPGAVTHGHPRQAHSEALLEAHVITGPDAGIVRALAIGRHLIGRGPGNSIRLADADVSRVHSELIVTADGVQVRDADSTNGTWLAARRIGDEAEPLGIGEPVRLGSSTIAVRLPERPPAAATLDGEGHLRVNRRPHLQTPRPSPEIEFPVAPSGRTSARLPWPAMLIPLLLAIPLAILWRQPTFLLFALMTPALMLGQFVVDRRSAGRDLRERRARYEMAREQCENDLQAAVIVDATYLETTRPDLARLAVTARTPTDELWRRARDDPAFLSLRLGRGGDPAAVIARRPAPNGTSARPDAVLHPDVPVAVDLWAARILGICGPRGEVLGLARSLIGQIAVLHSPVDARIDVLTADPRQSEDWRWVTRLPHHGDGLGAAVGETQTDRGDVGPPPPRRIVLLDGAHVLRQRPDVAAALGQAARSRREFGPSGPGQGAVLFICLDRTEQDLPVECGSTVTLDLTDPTDLPDPTNPGALHRAPNPGAPSAAADPGARVDAADATNRTFSGRSAILRRDQASPTRIAPDLASARWAERLSRHLAPLRDATPGPDQGLPGDVRLIDLLVEDDQVQPTDPIELARHWQRSTRPEPVAIIGVSAAGAFRIDLRRDGPHLLIGGTTGAGKSELLQTMVSALAVSAAPDAISFLLIDYKGGAAFRGCAALPHVGGVITDLDPHLARRALASLAAELRRRERLLSSVSAVDIDAYATARAVRPDLPPMPRLVVVVDEFRVLAEELPEFVSGLIRTATVGRSLGVHLMLATQRPSGVVSADITANVNTRIALRVRDGADSSDLIGEPAASLLPADRPGRALARVGSEPLVQFQTARVSGVTSKGGAGSPVVRVLDDGVGIGHPRVHDPAQPAGGQDVDDLTSIAAAARDAVGYLGLGSVSPPWLPALPNTVALDDLLAQYPRIRAEAGRATRSRRERLRVPFGLVDLPEDQCQQTAVWQLGDSHLAVAGGPRSGRTTVLRTIAQAAGALVQAGAPVPDSAPAQDGALVKDGWLGQAGGALESTTPVHLYVIDGSGALAGLQGSACVDAVISVHDTERAERLLRRLGAEISARQGGFTAADSWADSSSWTDSSPGSSAGSSTDSSPGSDIVLLIDGWEALTAHWAEVDHGRMIDQLMSALRDGPAVRVYAAISGGRSLLTGAISSLLAERLVLRFADPADAALSGVPTSRVGTAQPAGRGIFLGADYPAGSEVQVAVGSLTPIPQAPDWPAHEAWGIPELPRRLDYDELLTAAAPGQRQLRPRGMPSAIGEVPWGREGVPSDIEIAFPDHASRRSIPIGIGGDAATLLNLDLEAAPVTLLVGPPGSGRTSALRCIAAGLQRSGEPVLMLSGREEPSAHLAAQLSEYDDAIVLIDDVQPGESLGDGRSGVLGDLVAPLVGTRRRLVIASSANDVLAAYRGVLAIARTARSGLILGNPAPGDGEVFGLRLGRRPSGPPGRALLVQAGRAVPIQLSLPPLSRPPLSPPLLPCAPPDDQMPQADQMPLNDLTPTLAARRRLAAGLTRPLDVSGGRMHS